MVISAVEIFDLTLRCLLHVASSGNIIGGISPEDGAHKRERNIRTIWKYYYTTDHTLKSDEFLISDWKKIFHSLGWKLLHHWDFVLQITLGMRCSKIILYLIPSGIAVTSIFIFVWNPTGVHNCELSTKLKSNKKKVVQFNFGCSNTKLSGTFHDLYCYFINI